MDKIKYQPIEDALKEANADFDKSNKGSAEMRQESEKYRYAYVLGVIEAKYRFLTMRIDEHNKLISK